MSTSAFRLSNVDSLQVLPFAVQCVSHDSVRSPIVHGALIARGASAKSSRMSHADACWLHKPRQQLLRSWRMLLASHPQLKRLLLKQCHPMDASKSFTKMSRKLGDDDTSIASSSKGCDEE